MQIFEVILKNQTGTTVYKSLVPEVHVQEKVNTLMSMNRIDEVGGIFIKLVGDISDRYIQRYTSHSSKLAANSQEEKPMVEVKQG